MKAYVDDFYKQLQEGIDAIKSVKNTKPNFDITHVVVCGLGGSGIGGSLLKDFFTHNKIKMPIEICKDYSIPAWVNKNTLLIACSYSGNTEETLCAVKIARKQKAQIVCITSGGALAKFAQANKYTLYNVRPSFPPRAAFAYAIINLLAVCSQFGIISNKFIKEIESAIALLKKNEAKIVSEAKAIAKKVLNKNIIIYSSSDNEAVAVRLRQQINENSKVLCSHHVVPEMNHNELVGWAGASNNVAVLLMRLPSDHARSQARMALNTALFKQYTSVIVEMHSQGSTFLERALYLVHLGDHLSVELAILRGVDATEVKVIDKLKANLSKI